ncbi:MAG: efflux RND transporter periplasmic adaptor subunit, partial [Bacteroidales bacterium]|nr:efflux RND transporter periplasmic adaptor subunit [Bacteroidales bacterium]
KATYEYQKSNYDRQKGLYDKGLIAASDYESAQSSYLGSKYEYQQAQSSYDKAVKNLSYAWIYSPIDGVVLSRDVDEGQTVASGFSTPTLFTIAQDLKKMQVVADVDEADIGEVKEGQRVEFTVDAFPDDVFKGTVTQVRLYATTTSNVVTYEVVIDAPNPDLILMPGLTANVTIYILDKTDVITVPQKALIFQPEGYPDSKYDKSVWVMDGDGSLRNVEVKIGVTDGISTEITEGLKVGDRLVIGASVSAIPVKSSDTSKESSPFMPKHPEDGNNVRTK